jgi:hypothetical protein
MLAAVRAGDLLSIRPSGLGEGPFSGVGSALSPDDHLVETNVGGAYLRIWRALPAVADSYPILPYRPGRGVDGAAGASWQSPPRDITGLRC